MYDGSNPATMSRQTSRYRQTNEPGPPTQRSHACECYGARHPARTTNQQRKTEIALVSRRITLRQSRQGKLSGIDGHTGSLRNSSPLSRLADSMNVWLTTEARFRRVTARPSVHSKMQTPITHHTRPAATFFAMRPAIYPPLNPASIFTTVTFEAQLLSMPSRAAKPPKLAP